MAMADKEGLRKRVRDLEQAVQELEEKALPALREADSTQTAALSRVDGAVAALERRVEALEDEGGAIPPVDPPDPPEPPQEQILSLAEQQAYNALYGPFVAVALRKEDRGWSVDWRDAQNNGYNLNVSLAREVGPRESPGKYLFPTMVEAIEKWLSYPQAVRTRVEKR